MVQAGIKKHQQERKEPTKKLKRKDSRKGDETGNF
jgi:hypothetical protein